MVVFFGFGLIGIIVGYIWTRKARDGYWTRDRVMILCVFAGLLLGTGASFLGGSFFVKKEIVVEKYFIQPMIFDGKTVGAFEDSSSYIFQIKETTETETRLIKHNLSKKEIFFTDGSEERYLEIKSGKTCRKNMWIWFFYGGTGIFESKAVLKNGDSFLTLPRY